MQRKTGTIEVPGAQLFYEVTGSGPLLLIIQGGDGDADGTQALVEHLRDHYTVVTYDPRGLSRSTLKEQPCEPWFEKHVDDAHQILTELATRPAFVFGSSRGALVALALLTHYREKIHLAVVHEPPASQLLADDERVLMYHNQLETEQLFKREGVGSAMRKFAAISGLEFSDREPGVAIPSRSLKRAANLTFFLTHDAPAIHRYRLNLDALRSLSDRIVPAVGKGSAGKEPHQCGLRLATLLGVESVEFPGGHSGYVTHPCAFAAKLEEVLTRNLLR
jgi:pimeloyl-ACP methyl ester carboxylesterase